MVLVLTMVVLQSISFANYALTTKTTNIIYGSAPYLTFDGGRTRVTNTAALLGISLSDGRTFTPTTNNSSLDNPIVLPVAGQSFADIGMLVPTNTNSIALSSLIGTPYNYWGDDDGDGQGVNGVTATGSLNLLIVGKDGFRVARNEVLTSCNSPYKLTLSNTEGRLTTRYGVPNESRFNAGNATYYINPKTAPAICYVKPELNSGWFSGFRPQSVTPSSYGLNFPTTGAHNLFFDLDIVGNNQALSWAPVSHEGITATMTNSTSTRVRVTLTGPVSTSGEIATPSLPQVFELVGRDSHGNAVLKYGFELKQWIVNRGRSGISQAGVSSWCNRIGYRVPKVKDLTNATNPNCSWPRDCQGAEPRISSNRYSRHIGAGFFTEWGKMNYYRDANFGFNHNPITNDIVGLYWTSDEFSRQNFFVVTWTNGGVYRDVSPDALEPWNRLPRYGLCVYP
ncbi:hypothetical protein [Gilliamella sp. W8128]|uniref:hypothetical protein n=1 Tax=Gilliamella sp. W8128 TaxID=2751010 RepID=UPI0018DEBCBE|nr:hypothetical protein [Gilliamella sp. W8128]MBI0154627.1 hypothetical protein [Gilliamella sp. W8128]